ncbi:hypothetical protein P9112_005238 [Eukaryota sp. TZLM1-RC]
MTTTSSVVAESTITLKHNDTDYLLKIGSLASMEIIKELIRLDCVQSSAYCVYKKSEHTRIYARCKNKRCTFECYATRPKSASTTTPYKVKRYKAHSCDGNLTSSYKILPSSTDYLASLTSIRTKIQKDPAINSKHLKVGLNTAAGFILPKHTVKRVRNTIKTSLYGTEESSYKKLDHYLELLSQRNPGSVINLEKDTTDTFRRLFIALQGTIKGFAFCRSMVLLDGTHSKTKHKQVLLTSTSIDAEGHLYPLAFAVVSTENKDNWTWFCQRFRDAYGSDINTIVSDREKGLCDAVATVFVTAKHAFCVRHLTKNIGARFTGFIWSAARATTTDEFDLIMNEIRCQSKPVYEKLIKAGKHHWATCYFEGLRYGHLASNVVESLNAWLLGARGMPLVTMINEICLKLTKWFEERRTEAMNTTSIVCKSLWAKLKSTVVEARSLEVVTISRGG